MRERNKRAAKKQKRAAKKKLETGDAWAKRLTGWL
jgi:hypothetical protein